MKCPDCDKELPKPILFHTYRCKEDKLTITLEYDDDYK